MSISRQSRDRSVARKLRRAKSFDQSKPGRPARRVPLHRHPLRFDAVVYYTVQQLSPTISDSDAANVATIFGDNGADFALLTKIVKGEPWHGCGSTYHGGYGDRIKPAKIRNGREIVEYEFETIGNSSSGRENRRDRIKREAPRLIEEAQQAQGPGLRWLERSAGGLRMLLVALASGDAQSKALEILIDADPRWLRKVERLAHNLSGAIPEIPVRSIR